MQAVLLATAENEKLCPLTERTPSPLLPIGNRPVMEIVIEQLARSGLKKIIVCLCRRAGDIEVYFGSGSRWGVTLDYVLLREAWGSAGALFWAKSLLTEPFIVIPAATIIDLDFNAALHQHSLNQYAATVILHKNKAQAEKQLAPEKSGCHEGNTAEITAEEWCCETGVYILDPISLNWIPGRKSLDIHTHLLPTLSRAGLQVGAFVMDGYWNALDTFDKFQDAQKMLLSSVWRGNPQPGQKLLENYSQLLGRKVSDGIWVGRNTIIHPTAHLIPPVLLAENVRIGPGVNLGPEAVIGSDTIIADQATIRSSTVFDHTYIGKLINIEDSLVDGALVVDTGTAEHVQIPDQFLLSETPRTIRARYLNRALELVLTLLFLLLTLPLTLPIGLLTWLYFGKVFQSEPRLKITPGQSASGRSSPLIYALLHFRTRRAPGHANRLGRWLEQLEWDRIPELINVLTGEMRLVGTKPLAPGQAATLAALRHTDDGNQIPGFTGLWYMHTDPCSDWDETTVSNRYYAATQTWRQDMRILLMTPRAWIKRVKQPRCKEIPLMEE